MSHNLEVEAKKMFKVPKARSSNNLSPTSCLEIVKAEHQEMQKAVLAVRTEWITAEEEVKEAEKEVERIRKKEGEGEGGSE